MYNSIKEEFEKMKSDKLIIIIGLIVPIVINLLVGWELSKGVMDHIPIAIVDEDDSQLSRQIIQYFNDNNTFEIKYYPESRQELQELIEKSKVKTGMIIPKKFASDAASLRSPTILMIYDGSHMSVTSITKAKASEILLTLRTGATIKHLEGRLNMSEGQAYSSAAPISFESRMLYNPEKNFSYFMTPGYGTVVCQTGIALTAFLSIVFTEKLRDKKRIPGYALGKIVFYAGIGSLSLVTNLLVQIVLFKIPFRGSLLMAILLSILLALAVSALSTAVSAWIKNRLVAIVAVGLLIIPNSILAGYTWPVLSMLPIYQKMAVVIPFYHYGDNIRNLFLKGSIENAAGDISYLLLFTAIMYLITLAGIFVQAYNKQHKEDLAE